MIRYPSAKKTKKKVMNKSKKSKQKKIQIIWLKNQLKNKMFKKLLKEIAGIIIYNDLYF